MPQMPTRARTMAPSSSSPLLPQVLSPPSQSSRSLSLFLLIILLGQTIRSAGASEWCPRGRQRETTLPSPPSLSKGRIRRIREAASQRQHGPWGRYRSFHRASLSFTRATQVEGSGGDAKAATEGQAAAFDSVDDLSDDLALYNFLLKCDDQTISGTIKRSLDILLQAFRLYGPRKIFVSFNGGKDAVVIMHLARAALAKHNADSGSTPNSERLRVIYFLSKNEFPEVQEFIEQQVKRYSLDISTYETGFVSGLKRCIEGEGQAHLGFVLGTRKGDPNCGEQRYFEPSSEWMPPFMRINPVLDWDYGQIWKFLRWSGLGYPSLYDRGYTSLGGMHDTWENPHLRCPDGTYMPAHTLSDWSLERAGRSARRSSSVDCELADQPTPLDAKEAANVGLVVVGDEILKGRTEDTNTPYALKRFREHGMKIKRVSVIPDNEDDIVEEVRRQMTACDIVVTSGGLGPTHDDVTLYAVARALGQRMTQNQEMIRLISGKKEMQRRQQQQGEEAEEKRRTGLPPSASAELMDVGNQSATNFVPGEISLTAAERRMCNLPENSQLRTPKPGKWPVLQCGKVFILPGVPQFFEEKLDMICESYFTKRRSTVRTIDLSVDELKIVDALDSVVDAYPNVSFGCYPNFSENSVVKTVVTVEGDDQKEVIKAVESFLDNPQIGDAILKVDSRDEIRN